MPEHLTNDPRDGDDAGKARAHWARRVLRVPSEASDLRRVLLGLIEDEDFEFSPVQFEALGILTAAADAGSGTPSEPAGVEVDLRYFHESQDRAQLKRLDQFTRECRSPEPEERRRRLESLRPESETMALSRVRFGSMATGIDDSASVPVAAPPEVTWLCERLTAASVASPLRRRRIVEEVLAGERTSGYGRAAIWILKHCPEWANVAPGLVAVLRDLARWREFTSDRIDESDPDAVYQAWVARNEEGRRIREQEESEAVARQWRAIRFCFWVFVGYLLITGLIEFLLRRH